MSIRELADPRVAPPAYAIGVDPMTINELDAMYDPSVWATVIALRDYLLDEIDRDRKQDEIDWLTEENEALTEQIKELEAELREREAEYE